MGSLDKKGPVQWCRGPLCICETTRRCLWVQAAHASYFHLSLCWEVDFTCCCQWSQAAWQSWGAEATSVVTRVSSGWFPLHQLRGGEQGRHQGRRRTWGGFALLPVSKSS